MDAKAGREEAEFQFQEAEIQCPWQRSGRGGPGAKTAESSEQGLAGEDGRVQEEGRGEGSTGAWTKHLPCIPSSQDLWAFKKCLLSDTDIDERIRHLFL